MEKLNCGNLLTLHRVYFEFFFNLNPSLYAVLENPSLRVFSGPYASLTSVLSPQEWLYS